MQVNQLRQFVVGLCLFFCLLFVNAVAYRQTRQLHEDAALMVHTHEVMEALDDLLSTVKNAETDQRGYLITGEEDYLKSYDAAIAATKQKIVRIKQLIQDSPEEQDRIPRLQSLVDVELDELAGTVAFRKQPGFDAVRLKALTDQETKAMDALEDEVERMTEHEQDLLQTEEAANDTDYREAIVTIALSIVLAFATLGAFVWALRRYLRTTPLLKPESRP
jgi:CHASE3 domain sensor protein